MDLGKETCQVRGIYSCRANLEPKCHINNLIDDAKCLLDRTPDATQQSGDKLPCMRNCQEGEKVGRLKPSLCTKRYDINVGP